MINKIPSPKPLTIFLFLTAAGLTLASLSEVLEEYYLPNGFLHNTLQIFNTKGAAPTTFLFFLLLVCSFLLGLISKVAAEKENKRDAWSWRVLSIIFLFLSFDELMEIHHRAAAVVLAAEFRETGWFSYKWVIIYAPFVFLFGLYYLKFLTRLPERTKKSFMLSGVIMLIGAYLLEMPLARIEHLYGTGGLAFGLFAVFKRSFELFGVTLLVDTLLSYIENNLKRLLPASINEQQSGKLPV